MPNGVLVKRPTVRVRKGLRLIIDSVTMDFADYSTPELARQALLQIEKESAQ